MTIKNNQNEIFFRNWLFLSRTFLRDLLFSKKYKLTIFSVILFLILPLFPKISQAETFQTSVSVIITVCGNGVVELGEQCDGSDLDSQTCGKQGFNRGNLSCKADCTFDTSDCISGGGGGGGGGGLYVPETKVIIQGMAYPNTDVTILKDGKIAGIIKADNMANFKFELPGITPGICSLSLWAEDFRGRRSPSFSYTLSVQSGMTTTIANIFLPPTIDLDKDQVKKGEKIIIFGQTAPKSQVSVYVYSSNPFIKEVEADQIGAYFYNLDTTPLENGAHSTKIKSSLEGGLASDFSKTLNFQVLGQDETSEEPSSGESVKIIPANLNHDFNKKGRDIVNFVDVSILLYNWGKPKNIKTDLNNDGVVNYQDLSILLYHWTG
ncbi:MAG: hypothetical protein PHG83_00955 [Patescibacteria group bacterium]|nr:hypothetical protein [Patescibacteria group bacterium]